MEYTQGDLQRAIRLAVDYHGQDLDKAGKLYILHPLRVMLSVINQPIEVQMVAVLHDVVEDTDCTFELIEDLFGKDIRSGLESVSRIEYPVKELYSDFVLRSKANIIGRLVKIADLKDNMSPERHDQLPESEKGIMHRYEKAMAVLTE
jgi:(p)ppGpp synthase/HD superfamily hydrolase